MLTSLHGKCEMKTNEGCQITEKWARERWNIVISWIPSFPTKNDFFAISFEFKCATIKRKRSIAKMDSESHTHTFESEMANEHRFALGAPVDL